MGLNIASGGDSDTPILLLRPSVSCFSKSSILNSCAADEVPNASAVLATASCAFTRLISSSCSKGKSLVMIQQQRMVIVQEDSTYIDTYIGALFITTHKVHIQDTYFGPCSKVPGKHWFNIVITKVYFMVVVAQQL